MDKAEYVSWIAAESGTFAHTVGAGDLDAPVASCPDWTLAELAVHVGRVQRWAAEAVRTMAQERPSFGPRPEYADSAALASWLREGTSELVGALNAADEFTKMWTFSFDRSMGFWARRQANEVAVHRWDAQDAAGIAPAPIDARLASDGVDENLTLVAVRGGGDPDLTGEQTIHLHCTDVEGEWLVRRSADGLDIERVHAKGDVAARGSASDLDLYLWGRIPVDTLDVFGDVSILESFKLALKR